MCFLGEFHRKLDIPRINKNVPTTLARCEDEEKQCLSGIKSL